ncbi:lipopolysaccharide biosynthesis protein [Erwinia sp. OLTSP20]|uniref:glycosyltransferase family 4 protein n=1 Tax=unclassified Erwinia TaxID=2622719 RepID=UPI000C17AC02|nr:MULTISPECIES: glycosyltransferase family 4 protein [unclassified Erwinia]PIJ49661.1 lipopolysaccharide biosynthesis protein [Erwinia sp. OAMSP11]PIJ70076.1 lipopolysaccharide biosynthesis protein [Erwinia sp. OLSSP12]PIJ80573.1 lipopolysaccharide biosynthesis protein [Erwinia sp. OLCASP19]PIJ82738.1 lipopolysaccharide biosynthesis protein [Erwinia sp. OLMTSP26]PIJ84815.1 lipopolysaccharide biosynthesis protein [Erwinia sp. OLMDSP33]
MKKLHIINLAKMGGVERLFIQYINDFSGGRDDVICISNNVDPAIRQQIPQQKIIFANRLFNQTALKAPQFLRKYLLQWRVNRSQAEVAIVWDLVPGLISKPKRARLVYYDHGCSWRYPLNAKTLGFMSRLDGVISASYASNRVMKHRFNLACPHHVVINRIITPTHIDNHQPAPDSPLRIGTASRQVSLKGISVSLLMMKELLDRGHNVTLEVAGKGPDLEAFIALARRLNINKHVTFSGFQQDMSVFFNRTDVYMSTPVTEPFGLSCMEALYYGIPVIFPVIDGQPEVIKHNECGIGLMPTVSVTEHEKLSGIHVDFPYEVYDPVGDIMVPPRLLSHLACADAVERLCDRQTYHRFSQNAKNRALTHFDYKLFKTDFDGALMSIAGN